MKMPRWLRIVLRLVFVFAVLLSLFVIGVSWYANAHKEEILQTINKRLHKHVDGELGIDKMQLSLLRDFPGVSVVLHDVTLRDTQYATHKTNLVEIKRVSVDLKPLKLLSGSIEIKRIRLEDGAVNIFTNATGYSNISAFRLKKTSGEKHDAALLDKVQLINVAVNYTYPERSKHFRVNFKKLRTKTLHNKSGLSIVADVKVVVEQMSFNTAKGSFLHNKTIEGKLDFDYDSAFSKLTLRQQNIRIEKKPVKLQMEFWLAGDPVLFKVSVFGRSIMFDEALSWVTPAISSKISFIKVARPAQIGATIEGRMQYRDTPSVYVHWKTHNNELVTPAGKVEKCSFSGYYFNHVDRYGGHGDANSIVVLRNVKCNWLRIPLSADSIKVFDLKKPYLQCNVNASFPAILLNPIIGGESFLFENGNALVDINYNGRLVQTDSELTDFNGVISLDKAGIRYIPRNLLFKNCSALLELKGADLIMKQVTAETEKSKLNMSGVAPNFFTLFYRSPKDINIRWSVNSSNIDLIEFNSFLQPREKKPKIIRNTSSIARSLDEALDACSVTLDVDVKKLKYKTFLAEDIIAAILLKKRGFELQSVQLRHAGGTIDGNGSVIPSRGKKTAFSIHAHINGVKVDSLFYAFKNFGQQAINSSVIKGLFSASVYVEGNFLSKSKIDTRSITGIAEFTLENGALVGFKPLEKINKFIFKKRNLSNITFKDISNTLTFENGKIFIQPMRIESNVLNMRVDGVYAYDTGTDVRIEIPLRNPQKDELPVESSRKKKVKKGLVLYLRAIDGKDGNMVITWDDERQK